MDEVLYNDFYDVINECGVENNKVNENVADETKEGNM